MSNRIIVVGGGLAGLAAAIRIAEAGLPVDLFSLVPVKRSHSVCAQGGINAAKNMKGENDHPDIHASDTLFGGEYLNDQPPVVGMAHKAPAIIDLLDRMGVPFNRTLEGFLDFRRFGGTLHHRTAYSGATTGQQLLYALDEQVRRFENEGKVEKYEYWEFLSLVIDEAGRCKGITAMNVWDRTVHVFKAGAVCLATGGPGMVFGKSTNSVINTGAAASRVYQQGVKYGNGEFIQVHPTSIPGADKLRLISESVRGEGGRVWVPKTKGDKRKATEIPDNDRDYFLERKYPKYGNLVPRDVATREIFDICVNQGMGAGGKNQVYLDITPAKSGQQAEILERKLGGVFEIYRQFVGVDPIKEPMLIFPGMHYSMGGLWVAPQDNGTELFQMTNIPGCFAAGEVDFQYHGSNRLGANSLLSCIYGGLEAGIRMVEYTKANPADAPESVYEGEVKRQREINKRLLDSKGGSENVFALHNELGDWMTRYCTVVRKNDQLDSLLEKITELEERYEKIDLNDTVSSVNQTFQMARSLYDMIQLAKPIAKGARLRDESRGAHYKPDHFFDKPEKEKLGDPADTDIYLEFVTELEEKQGVTYKEHASQPNPVLFKNLAKRKEMVAGSGSGGGTAVAPPETYTAVSPEFLAYMKKWVETQRVWNKSSIATYKAGAMPDIEYRDVVMTFEPPRPRIYK
ncbi:MAG: succinate dehydrogenase flavoprotein subunit [Sumerlaeia bacterium]